MCGLAFVFDPETPGEERTQRVTCALDRLRHRGPDDSGIESKGAMTAGHRRLSIIDLVDSRQPMTTPNGRYAFVYNGEVYNYQELRPTLETDWTFRTQGDTEVMLAGLALKGARFLERCEGMWALALWDSKENKLLMARDRMGKKPLYYRLLGNGIACASELPALGELGGDTWHEDVDSTADYLRYGFYLPGKTAYSDVHEVLPGHVCEWQPEIGPSTESYWALAGAEFNGTISQARDAVASRFHRALERRLVSDVEVGAMLSGGIDSSLIVSYLKNEFDIELKTFTIGFAEDSYDERRYARMVAKSRATEHFEEVMETWDRDLLESIIIHHIGQPFSDQSILPTAAVSRLAAARVKVALSGDGGDEVFGGYQRYQARAILRWYSRLPRPLRTGCEAAIASLPEPMSHHSRSILKKAHLFRDVARRIEAETPYVAPVNYSRENFAAIAPEIHHRGHAAPAIPEQCQLDDVHRMMASDALVYLPQDILLKVDRASMAFSLETRAPFLDSQLVRLAFSLPRQWHRRGILGKRMLRETFGPYLPQQLWGRRKQGFAVPIHQWFREGLGEEFAQLLEDVSHPLGKPAVREMLHQHRARARDHGYRLWNLYVYLLWKQRQ